MLLKWVCAFAACWCGVLAAAFAGESLTVGVDLAKEKGVFHGDEPISATLWISNDAPQSATAALLTEVATDAGAALTVLTNAVAVPAHGGLLQPVSCRVPGPGFYRVTARLFAAGGGGASASFCLGYEPEKMPSASSAKPDFDAFWSRSLKELEAVEPRYTMVLLTNLCTASQNLFEVRMRSYGGETVGGHYLVPKKPGKYPTLVRFLGYSSGPVVPERDGQPCVRYVASTRGQGVMKSENTYGEWLAHRLDSRDDYYFRGAYLDTVRAIDFVCSRPEVDPSRLAVEGGSQGGALACVCAALDRRVSFCMAMVPGFCDIPNFIGLTQWPGCLYRNYLAAHAARTTKDELYGMLTYYDVKNFAPRIGCPVYLGIGLQDPICPPHTSFAAYNLLKCDKRVVVYPETGHGVRMPDYAAKAYGWLMETYGYKKP